MAPKRKHEGAPQAPHKKPRYAHFQDARQIAAQTSGKAFGNGEIDVDKFVKAREYEIRALEQGMRSSRSVLMSRAFQGVPRELRRRTASHNAKRVPKRLQKRALREMKDDKTPKVTSKTRKPSGHQRLRLEGMQASKRTAVTAKAKKEAKKSANAAVVTRVPRVKKSVLATPPRPKAKFRKRQIEKTWLPTHMFHTKRAHMTPPAEPLWRMAIPLTPTQKCSRPTHRAGSARGAIAWDMSYMATIGLEGTETALRGVMKRLGVDADSGEQWWESKATKRWLSGSRSWSGWTFVARAPSRDPIAPVTIIWDRSQASTAEPKRPLRRRAFIHVHPSAFLQLWEEALKIAKEQRPAVSVEDLRFEIGTIDIVGPAATEALVGTLWPCAAPEADEPRHQGDATDLWSLMKLVSNPSSLPAGAMINLEVTDPRLHCPPRTIDMRSTPSDQTRLMHTLANWPADTDQRVTYLLDRSARTTAARRLSSQKSISRRKGLSEPGGWPAALETDPRIPVVLLSTRNNRQGGQGRWTLLLPRKCVMPVWYVLMHYPLSTGGTLNFGGLEQVRQLNYEAGMPWFPGDFPGTQAGKDWEQQQAYKRQRDWEKRPKSKRVAWDSVDLGNGRRGEVGRGWACDWENLSGCGENGALRPFRQATPAEARGMLLARDTNEHPSKVVLAAVEIAMVGKGVVKACARVYRLPSADAELRARWSALANEKASRKAQKSPAETRRPSKRMTGGTAHEKRQELAASLLREEAHDTQPPAVPGEEDLIGFVTTGNFNLSAGRGSSIGSIDVYKARASEQESLCIVRDSGQGLGRLARWRLVP